VDVGFLSQVFYETKQSKKEFQVIPGTSKGWLPYYYMGVRTMIAGMNNWAPEIITALVKATHAGEVAKSEQLYLLMMDLSAKLHFTDSTIASIMSLYARGYDGGYPRKPMQIPPFDNPRYKEIRGWLQEGFERVGLVMDTGTLTT
jgi:dihydrodipicolinate synthase/N-acetylneuraminate lyase